MFGAAVLVMGLSASAFGQSPERVMPADFKSDNCSIFPDGNYCDCCVEHDKDYYFGGTGEDRWRSDMRLYKCVKAKKGWRNKLVAPVMWLGVRVLGVSALPTPFRWGFGKRKRLKMSSPAVIPQDPIK